MYYPCIIYTCFIIWYFCWLPLQTTLCFKLTQSKSVHCSATPLHNKLIPLIRSPLGRCVPITGTLIPVKTIRKLICTQEGKKKMFYLTTLSTHVIYGYTVSDIWKRTTQIARGNLLPHGLLFPIRSKGSFICTIPQTG